MRGTVIVAGSVAQRPGVGGHTWVFLQYLLGLRRLGWNAVLIDRLDADMCVDEAGRPSAAECSYNARYLREVMEDFGLADSYGVLCDGGSRTLGLSRREMVARARDSALLLNVMGFLDDEEILGAARKRVFVDIDPGFGQMWRDLGWADLFRGHEAHVTVGENIGQPDCAIPTCGIDWITTPQPVVLDQWPASEGGGGAFTSIGAWRGPYAPIEYRGATFGLRVHEFRRFMELPRRSGRPFEVALDIHSAEAADLARLRAEGWTLVEPKRAAGDPAAYRSFIRDSRAELMVAKNMYVQANSGWFSDRSICYLASGRPVLAQETGFSRYHPSGEGLLSFSTMEEALAGVAEIDGDYRRHSRAAREIAEEQFDSDRVFGRLLDRLGVA